ncbi:trypsin-like serine peptidase [Candidatus Marimicrobium litorale]|uniref:Serine protease n=1 Tax=Candidatus Marimicrobium litorale TaxID=2518991 RepID=A0ABT3T326_9GAMM|nr:trypsin-like peptidase domain-containing protein [Candidatus Marimicrobium litorale]MCX2976661.1 serine protease [Candidatus Marimicrobium litorale]
MQPSFTLTFAACVARQIRRKFRAKVSFLCLLLLSSTTLIHADDNRQVYSSRHQPWLQAVGKLRVPGQRYEQGRTKHYVEDCSATLVARRGRTQADIIVTAWHCLEYYRDLSRPIVFSTRTGSGEPLYREARRLVDGGGMHADWAVLALAKAIPVDRVPHLTVTQDLPNKEHPVIMAGYSRDSGLGKHGTVLTFDPACAIVREHLSWGSTNCRAYKGSSGGAVIQLRPGGSASMVGVISQGNGEGTSLYVPAANFRSSVARYLD